jgi:hypothetical protein
VVALAIEDEEELAVAGAVVAASAIEDEVEEGAVPAVVAVELVLKVERKLL